MSTVLVVHAHPDDETFANAGRISQLAADGHRVVGVIATGGEASESGIAGSFADARARRLGKYERALSVLGAASWEWLEPGAEWVDLPDGPLVAHAEPARLVRGVVRLLEKHAPDMLLTVGADGLTGHPDHVAVGRAVHEAVREYHPDAEVWGARLSAAEVRAGHDLISLFAGGRSIGSGRVTGTSADLIGFDVAEQQDSRRKALDAYRDGLGTGELRRVINEVEKIGDSLLLRAAFDTDGWTTERYERLDTAR